MLMYIIGNFLFRVYFVGVIIKFKRFWPAKLILIFFFSFLLFVPFSCGKDDYIYEMDHWFRYTLWMQANGNAELTIGNDSQKFIDPMKNYLTTSGELEIYLRLVKAGNVYSAYYKTSQVADWSFLASFPGMENRSLKVCLYSNDPMGEDYKKGDLLVQYDYFKDESQNLFTDDFSSSTLNPQEWSTSYQSQQWDLGITRADWLTIIYPTDSYYYSTKGFRIYQNTPYGDDFDISTRMYCKWNNLSAGNAGFEIQFN